jgi:hypothetical protein
MVGYGAVTPPHRPDDVLAERVLFVVAGAAGAGKSSAAAALAGTLEGFACFDVDWLADAASELAGRSVYDDPRTWPAYRGLWAQVLEVARRNGQRPVLFTPADPREASELVPSPDWRIEWLLLDCDDELRAARLRERPRWSTELTAEALADAAFMRAAIAQRIDTGAASLDAVAAAIRAWLTEAG